MGLGFNSTVTPYQRDIIIGSTLDEDPSSTPSLRATSSTQRLCRRHTIDETKNSLKLYTSPPPTPPKSPINFLTINTTTTIASLFFLSFFFIIFCELSL
ncbi:hypothetical protein L6452_33933 [Arctium lappa]|uniref:Uncharacterized protein n=1 Tax=Arctium lappa TaxID=4217 RepID=A0ACB8YHS5_ARCLA|nr:hypothetical protein L6452_33933 [Arctium lappa]